MPLTSSEFRAIGAKAFGHDWRTPMAKELGTTPHRVHTWANGSETIPDDIERQVVERFGRAITPEIVTRAGEALFGDDWREQLADTLWLHDEAFRYGADPLALRPPMPQRLLELVEARQAELAEIAATIRAILAGEPPPE